MAGMEFLCPTSWIVQPDTLASDISNCEVLLQGREETVDIPDTETKGKMNGGIFGQMQTFACLFATWNGLISFRQS